MKDLDLEFCLSWANETWSRRWDGQEHHILQLQTHTPSKAAWGAHFDYLVRAWSDRRALRIDGRPVFMIYRPDKVERVGEMFDYWQSRAREHGLDGLYFVAVQQYAPLAFDVVRHFDAIFRFQPAVARGALAETDPPFYKRHFPRLRAAIPRPIAIRLQSLIDSLQPDDAASTTSASGSRSSTLPVDRAITTFEGAYVDWDNTARYGKRATVYEGARPERFQYWLERLVDKVRAHNRPDERIVFINAWNEWAEGAYLEPDERYGDRYLQAIRAVASNQRTDRGLHAVRS